MPKIITGQMFPLLLIASITFQVTLAVEIFENSTNLCTKRCICNLSNDNKTLYINCANGNMKHTIANWPEHPENLVASFNNNEIVTLERMPGSDAEDIKLIFSNCKIKYLNTGLFEGTINIKYLDLSHNFIESEQLSSDVFKGPYNDTFYEPIALEHLDLSYNQIHSLQKNLFEHTPNLKYLSLEGNSLRIIDRHSSLALAKITKLQILNVARNRLIDIPSDAIKHFPNLTELNLAFNELDFVPESLGFVAESLQVLNVSNNPIIEFDHNTFQGMENLLKLFSSNSDKLLQIRARAFTPLKRLKTLELSHNKELKDIDDEAFERVNELEEVYLNDNGLITLPTNLLPWNQLVILDIRNNEFVCNCNLYNISIQLPNSLKSNRNTPFCLNPRTYLNMEIYSLTNETCSLKPDKGRRRGLSHGVQGGLKIMKVTLSTLILVLVIASAIAVWLSYTKWRTYKRSLRYPFPNQIFYSPVSTTEFSRF